MMRKHIIILILTLLPLSSQAIDIYAHRGGAYLMPENTLPAFENAIKNDFGVLDMDVGQSQDGVIVVAHDPFVNPALTRDPQGHFLKSQGPFLKNLTFKEIEQYHVGQLNPDNPYHLNYPKQKTVDHTTMPALSSVFDLGESTHKPIRYQIEIKTDPSHMSDTVPINLMAKNLLALIEKYKLKDRVEIQSFDWNILVLIHKVNPQLSLSFLTDKNSLKPDAKGQYPWLANHNPAETGGSIPALISRLGGKNWCPNIDEITWAQVQEAHKLKLRVVVWTANTPTEMKRMVSLGVDGIISDRPDLLKEMLAP